MGCLSSKPADDAGGPRVRVQTEVSSRGAGASGAQPGTANVAIKNASRLEDNFSLARSPHDVRFEERDFFKSLVEHTASNLIDVSQAADFLSPTEAEARQRLYDVHLRSVALDQRMRMLFSLPETNPANGNVADLLDAPAVPADAVAFSRETSNAVAAAVSAVKVVHEGDLVVALPEIRSQ
eukprot:Amastigsp_a841208_321.p1 type:complete len:181 gc:universal Amastigsp_a841208_321:87-629(+)